MNTADVEKMKEELLRKVTAVEVTQGSNAKVLEDRIAELEKLQKRATEEISKKVALIEESQAIQEKDFPKEDRITARQFILRGRAWVLAAFAVVAMGGVGMPIGISYLLNWITNQALTQKRDLEAVAKNNLDDARTEINKRLGQALKEANDVIKDQLSSTNLRHELAKEYTSKLEAALTREFKEDFSIHAAGMIAGVKLYIESLSVQAVQTPSAHREPKILREILYSLQDLERTYSDKLAAGKMETNKRSAFLYAVSALFDRARGFHDREIEWLMEAIRTDGTFAEAQLFLAQAYAQKVHYKGDGKWSNEEDRITASEAYGKAVKLFSGRTDAAARLAACSKAMLDATISHDTNAHINFLTTVNGHIAAANSAGQPEPRCLSLVGLIHLNVYQDEAHLPKHRIESAKAFLLSFTVDPEFIRSLNNFIWMVTHDFSDKITLPLSLDGSFQEKGEAPLFRNQDEALFRDQMRVLENHPLAQEDPAQLNTLAEAYASLCTKDRPLELVKSDALKARRIALKALTVARLINSPQVDAIRNGVKRIDARCDDALRR